MPEQSSGLLRARLMRSTIEHDMVGRGGFAMEQIEKDMMIGYYRGTLINVNLYGDKKVERTKGDREKKCCQRVCEGVSDMPVANLQ